MATRNKERTKQKILAASLVEFSKNGFSGARVDTIAARAKVNKALIYHHFKDKDELFNLVLEKVYGDLQAFNKNTIQEDADPIEGIRTLILNTFDFFAKHPEFISIVNNENLLKSRHLKKNKAVQEMFVPLLEYLTQLLKKGADQGIFQPNVDPLNFYISIAGMGYFYFSNKYSLSEVFGASLTTSEMIEARRRHVVDLLLGYITNLQQRPSA